MTYVLRLHERYGTDARNTFPDCRGNFVRVSGRVRGRLSVKVFIIGFLASGNFHDADAISASIREKFETPL